MERNTTLFFLVLIVAYNIAECKSGSSFKRKASVRIQKPLSAETKEIINRVYQFLEKHNQEKQLTSQQIQQLQQDLKILSQSKTGNPARSSTRNDLGLCFFRGSKTLKQIKQKMNMEQNNKNDKKSHSQQGNTKPFSLFSWLKIKQKNQNHHSNQNQKNKQILHQNPQTNYSEGEKQVLNKLLQRVTTNT